MTTPNPKPFFLYLFLILLVGTLSCKQSPHKQHIHKPSIHLVQFADLNSFNVYYYDSTGRIQSWVTSGLDKYFMLVIDSTTYGYDDESGRILASVNYHSFRDELGKGKKVPRDTAVTKYVYNATGTLLENHNEHDTVSYIHRNNLIFCRQTYNHKQLTWIDSMQYDSKGNLSRLTAYSLFNGKYVWPTIENKRYDNKISYTHALPEAFRLIYSMTDSNNCTKILCRDYPCRTYTYKYNAEGYPVAGKAAGVITQDSIWFKYKKF
jgi:hypothetical protein